MEARIQAQEDLIAAQQKQMASEREKRDTQMLKIVADFTNELDLLRARHDASTTNGGPVPAAAESAAPTLGQNKVIDTTVLGEPDMYYGEREKWNGWSFVFRVYMMAVDREYAEVFDRTEHSDVPMYNSLGAQSTIEEA